MKSIPKLIRRFAGIMTLSIILLFILNIIFFAIVFVRNTSTFSPWDMAEHAAAALQLTYSGYSISDDVTAELKEENAWAFLIDNDTRQVVWRTDHLPDNIPMQYTLPRLYRRISYFYGRSPKRIIGIRLPKRQILEAYKGELGLSLYCKFTQEHNDYFGC